MKLESMIKKWNSFPYPFGSIEIIDYGYKLSFVWNYSAREAFRINDKGIYFNSVLLHSVNLEALLKISKKFSEERKGIIDNSELGE